MAARGSISDFSIANPLYPLSEVSVHIANPDGSKGALATLYAGPTGADTLPNPQTLDSQGKWQQPVYIEDDVILDIDNPDDDLDGETGIVYSGGRWRSYWTGPGTRYNRNDAILGPIGTPEENNVYRSNQVFSSGGTWAGDLATPGLFELELDYQALRALAMAAVPLASETVAGRIEIATQAETNAGLSDALAITPLKLATMQATETQKGVAEVATQAETNGGSNDTTIVTPAKLHARVASTALQGLIAIATQSEVDAGTVNTEAVTPLTLWTTPIRGGWKNLVGENSGFEVWQRGAGGAAAISVPAVAAVYGPDRWYLLTGANQASFWTQVGSFMYGHPNSARVQRNAGQTGTGFMWIGRPFAAEEISRLLNRRLTLRFSVRAGANWSPTNGTLQALISTGTGALQKRSLGFTSESFILTSNTNLTPGVATTVQVVASQVVPANASQMELFFQWVPTGTAGAFDGFDITAVDLRADEPVIDQVEQRPFDDCLRACQRHFWKTFAYNAAPATGIGGGAAWRGVATGAVATDFTMPAPANMRTATPTITTFNPSAANAQVRNNSDAADCTGTGGVYSQGGHLQITYTANAGATVNESFSVAATIDAGI